MAAAACGLGSFRSYILAVPGLVALQERSTNTWCGGVTFVLLKMLDVVMGLRVSREEETEGLDLVLHEEKGYNL